MNMKKIFNLLLALVMVITLAACPSSAKKGYRIGFTDNYNGNTYHQSMERYMQEVAAKLIEEGHIAELTIVEANQDAATQISQIEDFITQGYDLIIIDPCSTSSLKNAVEEAVDAEIPCLVINDGPINYSHKLVYQLNFNFTDLAETLTRYVCETIGGEGKIIELRGTAGTTCDTEMHQGVLNALKDYPKVEIVAEIYTDWTGSKAQTELNSILPILDKVDGLVTQGGDAYAAVQAFLSAGYKTLPVIAGDNRGYFINWWNKEAPEGYKTISGACNPWDAAISMYIAVDILNGLNVANNMNCPFGYVTAENVAEYTSIGDEEVAIITYDWETIRSEIEQAK